VPATDLEQQVVDRGGEAVQKLAEGARDSAQAQGLSGDMSITDVVKKAGSGELLGSMKNVALDALKAGEEAVRDKGSPPTSSSTQLDTQAEPPAQSGPAKLLPASPSAEPSSRSSAPQQADPRRGSVKPLDASGK